MQAPVRAPAPEAVASYWSRLARAIPFAGVDMSRFGNVWTLFEVVAANDPQAHNRGMKAFGLIVGAALLLVPSAFGRPDARPALTLVDRSPVVVRGTGFIARERVLVTVRSGVLRAWQRASASARGAFVLRFDGLRLTACTGGTLVATGRQGSVAQLKLGLRECPGPVIDP
jgi:hypothetical protein